VIGQLFARTAEVCWLTGVAAVIGRRTMRANWSRMHDLHRQVLERMQTIETLIVEHGLGRRGTGRHQDECGGPATAAMLQQPTQPMPLAQAPFETLLCFHSEHVGVGLPPRHARAPRRYPTMAKYELRPGLVAGLTLAVLAVASMLTIWG